LEASARPDAIGAVSLDPSKSTGNPVLGQLFLLIFHPDLTNGWMKIKKRRSKYPPVTGNMALENHQI
jgi:hypothetical protein